MTSFADQYADHETPADEARQREVCEDVAQKRGLTFQMAAKKRPWDAVFFNGKLKPTAYAEVKCRNHVFGHYNNYTIDVEKVLKLTRVASAMRVQAVLIVAWQDVTKYAVLREFDTFLTSEQKRRDRDELTDTVYHIPLSLFKEP